MDFKELEKVLSYALRQYHIDSSEIIGRLQDKDFQARLEVLANYALDSRYTDAIFACHEEVFVEISSLWLRNFDASQHAIFAAYARLLPHAPYLKSHLSQIVKGSHGGYLTAYFSGPLENITRLPVETLRTLLIAIHRLLRFDNRNYATYLSPVHLTALLKHSEAHVRFLAVHVLAQYFHASHHALQQMIENHVGPARVIAAWDSLEIDYTFFPLWEQNRDGQLSDVLRECRQLVKDISTHAHTSVQRRQTNNEWSETTAAFGDVLLPRRPIKHVPQSLLIPTETTVTNIQRFATAFKSTRPLIVSGASGSGKSVILQEIARGLGCQESMVVLHVNDQIDTKLLLGTYVSATSSGQFRWQPGVLTSAVSQGKWLVIEDIDRAPLELMGVLKGLIERHELILPSQDQTIASHPAFRLFGTIRTSQHDKKTSVVNTNSVIPIGCELWEEVRLDSPSFEDLEEIVATLYPNMLSILPIMRGTHDIVTSSPQYRQNHSRHKGPMQLLRWCRRIHSLLNHSGISKPTDPISQSTTVDIFLESFDNLTSHLSGRAVKQYILERLAQDFRVPLQMAEHTTNHRSVRLKKTKTSLEIGRAKIETSTAISGKNRSISKTSATFAQTAFFLRNLEKISLCVEMSEPCLLVGETGSGKTSAVQFLADACEQKLEVFNLSHEIEAGDLLGSFKPVNPRSMVVPIREEFQELLALLFPSRRNEAFMQSLDNAIIKGTWTRALRLWDEAIRSIDPLFHTVETANGSDSQQPKVKRRKLNAERQALRPKWCKFMDDVDKVRAHISSDSGRGFGFAFVESRLIHALRNGHWVLLDEINLASSDVLELVGDLFSSRAEQAPSVLLSEAGRPERVWAHNGFRIFAAMNPATDIGKKSLPSSIQAKFTEIYCDQPDEDVANLVAVAQAFVGEHVQKDNAIADDVANVYVDVKNLSSAERLVDGSGRRPHFSLRTFSRVLRFIQDTFSMFGLRRAAFEGFQMSISSTLNAESAAAANAVIEHHLLGRSPNPESIKRQQPRQPADGEKYVKFQNFWLLRGNADLLQEPHYIITPFVKQNLQNLVRGASTRRFPILLQGPTSSGKTSMVEHLAKATGNTFVRVNNHEHTDIQEYLGAYLSDNHGHLAYHDGVLVTALKKGHWIVLDELNLAPTDILEALNRLLDDNRELIVPETQEKVRPHRNFMLFATQNPPGAYGGRKMLSRAFQNRFLELHFNDIPENELEIILRERCRIAPSFASNIVSVHKDLAVLRQSNRVFEQRHSFATLRDLFRWASRGALTREDLAIQGFMLLAERVRMSSERGAVRGVIEHCMKSVIREEVIYAEAKCKSILENGGAQGEQVIWTKSMRRTLILVIEALKRNEPVLLIGETGSGKTTICQVIAEAMNRPLTIMNAHQNLETGDLIGTQRPTRNRNALESELRQTLIRILESEKPDMQTTNGHFEEMSTETLLRTYDDFLKTHEAPTDLQKQIQELRVGASKLFEWHDGSVVFAMKQGNHFLLDEISLAEDAVLERLNSLLEPDRSLYLAEKGASEPKVTAHKEFQFLATMNPGGDYGKRELSAALRNRLTEIWIPPISDTGEILEIAQSKLKMEFRSKADPMVRFSKWYNEEFEGELNQTSIRDLLSWIWLVNRNGQRSLHQAVLTGATSVYLDRLGASPSSKVAFADVDISKHRQTCVEVLQRMFDIPSLEIVRFESDAPLQSELLLKPHDASIEPTAGSAPRYTFAAPTANMNARKLLRALNFDKPVLIEGSAGVGKTTLVAAVAEQHLQKLTRINLSDQTDLVDLFGSDVPVGIDDVGHFAWSDAPFLTAMKEGSWVLLDEMNLASQSVLEGLNACFDHRGEVYIPELSQTFTKHPDFRVFATQNPHHQGAGRKGLPQSFVNRFTVIFADSYNNEDLVQICLDSCPGVGRSAVDDVVHFANKFDAGISRSAYQSAGTRLFNIRDALRWLRLLHDPTCAPMTLSLADFVPMLFAQRARGPSDQIAVTAAAEKLFHEDNGHYVLIGRQTTSLHVGLARVNLRTLQSPTLYTNSFCIQDLAIAESILFSISYSWPTLLVGSSEQAMTSVVHLIAAHAGTEVVQMCLHAGTDSADLLGGYEQVDVGKIFERFIVAIRKCGQAVLLSLVVEVEDIDNGLLQLLRTDWSLSMIDSLFSLLKNLSAKFVESSFSMLLHEYRDMLTPGRSGSRKGFAWLDGPLIKAIREGKWLILEQVNLCDAAVLDRLNCLLEPGGTLALSGKRTSEGLTENIVPHSDFRVFMTMNPARGELSQAMRSRCVELFVSFPNASMIPKNSLIVLDPSLQPSLARLAALLEMEWAGLDRDVLQELAIAFIGMLSPGDLILLPAFCEQCSKRLGRLPAHALEMLHQAVQVYQQILLTDTQFSRRFRAFREGTPDSYPTSHFPQFVHPHCGTLKPNRLPMKPQQMQMHALGKIFTLLIHIHKTAHVCDRIAQQASGQKRQHLSVLEMSLLKPTDHFKDRDILDSIGAKIMSTLIALRMFVECISQSTGQDEVHVHMASCYLEQVQHIISTAQTPSCNRRRLIAQLQVAAEAVIGTTVSQMNEDLNSAFQKLTQEWTSLTRPDRPSSGFAMYELWTYLRPPLPSCVEQHQYICQARSTLERFDGIKWNLEVGTDQIIMHYKYLVLYMRAMSMPNWQHNRDDRVEFAMKDLCRDEKSSHTDGPSFFEPEIDMLRQIETLRTGSTSDLLLELSCLSDCVSTGFLSHDANFSPVYDQLERFTFSLKGSSQESELTVFRGQFSLSLLHRLSVSSEISLRALSRFESDIRRLLRHVASMLEDLTSDLPRRLFTSFRAISNGTVSCIQEAVGACPLTDLMGALNDLPRRLRHHNGVNNNVPDLSANVRWTVENLLRPTSTNSMISSVAKSSDQIWQIKQLAAFFVGLLLLYIPDQLFDPIDRTDLKRENFLEQVKSLQNRVKGLQVVEHPTGEHQASYRMMLAVNELKKLAAEPIPVSIFRLSNTGLASLKSDFANILRVLVACPLQFQESLDQNHLPPWTTEIGMFLREIEVLIIRIQENKAGAEDVVKPLLLMLEGLQSSLKILRSINSTSQDAGVIKSLAAQTPLMNSKIPESTARSDPRAKSEDSIGVVDDINCINNIILAYDIQGRISRSALDDLFTSFQNLYRFWKMRLAQDRQEEKSKTSLYRYQDPELILDEDSEIGELFSPYVDRPLPELTVTTDDPRALAQRAASLHVALFTRSQNQSERILKFLRDSASRISQIWIGSRTTASSPLVTEDLLPAALSSMFDYVEKSDPVTARSDSYSFYNTENIAEARKLLNLTKHTHLRFLELQNIWPDHEVLNDIIKTCNEIFNVKHTEPIAKLMLNLESLHRLVNEWQTVASAQYSASNILTTLSDLIISWRRLELTTWSQLLDTEDRKCDLDADSWWFIAYENIVASPMSSDLSMTEMRRLAETLLETLRHFIATTPMGQFRHRLCSLRFFRQYLDLIAQRQAPVAFIANALDNLIQHYSYHEAAVQKHIHDGRKGLEQEVKEIILLASWKDTNIVALRESSKRSHHKLFKIVRRYRTLLAGPVQTILDTGYQHLDLSRLIVPQSSMEVIAIPVDVDAQRLCADSLSWGEKSMRHQNTQATSTKIARILQLPDQARQNLEDLASYFIQLREEVRVAQSGQVSHGSSLSEQNSRDWVTAKRKLFADTLGVVRDMGFRSTLNQEVLDQQNSLAKVWTVLAADEKARTSLGKEPYELLSAVSEVMMRVRQRVHDHHTDINNRDSHRAYAMLENLFATLIKQRNFFDKNQATLSKLQDQIGLIARLWSGKNELYQLSQDDCDHQARIRKSLVWLVPTIESVRILVLKTGKYTGRDLSSVSSSLEIWKFRIGKMLDVIDALPKNPDRIQCSRQTNSYAQALTLITDFGEWCRSTMRDCPSLKCILSKVELWTALDRETGIDTATADPLGTETTMTVFDDQITKIIDRVLVQVQQAGQGLVSFPQTQSDKGWLLHTTRSLSQCVGRLHFEETTEDLESVLANLHKLRLTENLSCAAALMHVELPILREYYNCGARWLHYFLDVHQNLLQLTVFLVQTFARIQTDGLCIASPESDVQEGQAEKVDGGTGLGSGEGHEDISKDVEADEDLSELAAEPSKLESAGDLEVNEDAVNMDADDLEGELGAASQDEGTGSSSENESTGDLDDEVHDVGQPSDIDEKFWDGNDNDLPPPSNEPKHQGNLENNADQDLGPSDGKNEKKTDSADEENRQEDGEDVDEPLSEMPHAMDEGLEQLQSLPQEEDVLELPPELKLDNVSESGSASSLDDIDLADASSESANSDLDTELGAGDSNNEISHDSKDIDLPAEDKGPHSEADADEIQARHDSLPESGQDPNSNVEPGADAQTADGQSQNQAADQARETKPSQIEDEAIAADDTQEATSKQAEGSAEKRPHKETGASNSRADEVSPTERPSQSLQQLGNALQEWRRTRKELQQATERDIDGEKGQEAAQGDVFEHLGSDQEETRHQAMGTASEDQASALDKEALAAGRDVLDLDTFMQDVEPDRLTSDEQSAQREDREVNDAAMQLSNKTTMLVTRPLQSDTGRSDEYADNAEAGDATDFVDNDMEKPSSPPTDMALAQESMELWIEYEKRTSLLACQLTEELRLILEPTRATRMRGDFRSGKRINMKRIIPYIASEYRKDKIWMRRSLPSKRHYQIILAVDDSISMRESGSDHLAFESLALTTRSLTMLEAGQVCVLGFGTVVKIAHDFGTPLNQNTGAAMIESIQFKQSKTDVRGLLTKSIEKFQDARGLMSSSSADCWHLELVISDGICEEHDAIRRLVRRAQTERIMIIFVIVDSIHPERSISDMSQATFEPGEDGESKLVIKRYLDDFPFPYYLIVNDIKELPSVLAQALKQWFSEVQDAP